MNMILTGETASGKTTACLKLAALLEKHNIITGGIICENDRIKDLSGASRKFYYSAGTAGTVSVGRYHIKRSALAFGSRAIDRACQGAGVIFIDEFGRLECNKEGFYGAATRALTTGRSLVVVRKSILASFKSLFPQYRFATFLLTPANRDRIHETIFARVTEQKGGVAPFV